LLRAGANLGAVFALLEHTFCTTLKPMKNLLILALGLGLASAASAEIYKSVDADGHVTYSNVPMKGATKLDLEPPVSVNVPAAKPAASKTPASFPKVDKEEQKLRDQKRKQVLEEELAAERDALEEAKAAYAEGESKPEVFRTTIVGKDGKPQVVTRRNVAKFQEKMKTLQENVDLHQKNIEMLEKELAQLK